MLGDKQRNWIREVIDTLKIDIKYNYLKAKLKQTQEEIDDRRNEIKEAIKLKHEIK